MKRLNQKVARCAWHYSRLAPYWYAPNSGGEGGLPPFNHARKVGKASSAVETLNGVDESMFPERGVESQERRASRALHVPRKLL